MSQRLYLDHAATTPMVLAAREAMRAAIARWANPSSPHAEGRAARAMLEDARSRIAKALGWDGEVILTGGATEAIRIALVRTKCDARIVSAVEHEAVHRVASDAFFLPVQQDGTVLPDALTGRLGALGAKAPLVAIQAVNNEIGVCQPVDQLAPIVRKAGGLLFADCAQSAGKAALPDADLIAISAHKFGGPPGVGALLVRDLGMLETSGGQEKGYRAGTENLPGVVAMAAALEEGRGWVDRAADLRAHLDGAIEAAGGEVVAKRSPRLATIGAYRMPGVAASAQLIQLDLAGIAISAGSACSSGTLKSSHVLSAMGWGEAEAGQVIRASFGPETSRADIYRFVEAWKRIAESARSRAA
ncbi:cysteine desulfurase family protein [Sphingomonas sp.]|uniref:cysteine desulfurase family protein n=1 Tax=Sphingomonas sp. TaxID=28214 RepID=UPI002DB87EB1|nr:aminotransferase class V-fold PLP-dependent enzyme [Sphingomonas sp.]HEU4967982.1 aminotransferase class V-fold PLP-dependent enzyme [Sphingomonas sp.]